MSLEQKNTERARSSFPKEVNDQTVEVQLGDTGRRTWRRKAERPVMGNHPVAAFKFLYRHECMSFVLSSLALTDISCQRVSETRTL